MGPTSDADCLKQVPMTHRHLLMCPPDFYGIEYEINPWMKRKHAADHSRAVRQWQGLKTTLESLDGVRIELVQAVQGLPDMVFTANAGLVVDGAALPSHFRFEERQGEESHYRSWFLNRGCLLRQAFGDRFFEGEGDALWLDETLYLGHGVRSEGSVAPILERELGATVVPLELVNPYFYHLDTCFMPLGPGRAIWLPGAFSDQAKAAIGERVDDLIEVTEPEARRFACNAVVIGNIVVLNSGCASLRAELLSRGYTPIELELDEFLKAGGAAKCLVLYLDP